MKAEYIVAIEAVALESVDDHGGLEGVFEVSKAEDNCVMSAVSLDQTDRFEAGERPEKV